MRSKHLTRLRISLKTNEITKSTSLFSSVTGSSFAKCTGWCKNDKCMRFFWSWLRCCCCIHFFLFPTFAYLFRNVFSMLAFISHRFSIGESTIRHVFFPSFSLHSYGVTSLSVLILRANYNKVERQ